MDQVSGSRGSAQLGPRGARRRRGIRPSLTSCRCGAPRCGQTLAGWHGAHGQIPQAGQMLPPQLPPAARRAAPWRGRGPVCGRGASGAEPIGAWQLAARQMHWKGPAPCGCKQAGWGGQANTGLRFSIAWCYLRHCSEQRSAEAAATQCACFAHRLAWCMKPRADRGSTAAGSAAVVALPGFQSPLPLDAAKVVCLAAADGALPVLPAILRPSRSRWGSNRGPCMAPAARPAAVGTPAAATWRCASWRCSSAARLGPALKQKWSAHIVRQSVDAARPWREVRKEGSHMTARNKQQSTPRVPAAPLTVR